MLNAMKCNHTRESVPFGDLSPEWRPLVPRQILDAIFAAYLLCVRLRVPHGVARIIATYVFTDGHQWDSTLELYRQHCEANQPRMSPFPK